MTKMSEVDIKNEINRIIKQRQDDINRILSMVVTGENSKAKTKSLDYLTWIGICIGIWIGYGLAALSVLFVLGYILYKSYKSTSIVKLMVWVALLASYMVSVFYIHDIVFDGHTNTFNMSISFIPIAITMLLLFINPNISMPLDNTIGYFCVTRAPFIEGLEVMKQFKSRLFPKEDMLDELGNEISFNWLLTTFDVKHIQDCVNQLKKDQEFNVTDGSILTDFYIDNPTEDVAEKITDLVEMKRTFGRGASLLIASAFGLAGSIVYSAPAKMAFT